MKFGRWFYKHWGNKFRVWKKVKEAGKLAKLYKNIVIKITVCIEGLKAV